MQQRSQPSVRLHLGDARVTLLGTAHVSRTSANEVTRLLAADDFDAVAVELCASRYQAISDPDQVARLDLLRVLREGRGAMVMAGLALAGYQQRLADQLGVHPGAEQRIAIALAEARDLPVLLIDREIGTTLKRVAHKVPWWRRLGLFAGLLASAMSREHISEEEVERLKDADVLETLFSDFARVRGDLYAPLIDERDRYMAARLRQEVSRGELKNILAVVGAGHLKGVAHHLEADRQEPEAALAELDEAPQTRSWPRVLAWAVAALVLAGFGYGFSQSPHLGWELVTDWVLINGGLSALGALVAAAHPLTVLAAFLAAPLTSLNPTIGAGMVSGAVELFVRRPSVGDFGRLRQDTASLAGWWRNRVSRTLLVFFFSTLGSAIGTYLAGYRILDHLVS